ncbi:MAG: hypothetical protein VKL59_16090 [Nostocaceae cyanobacterium]|nr:hypothetical protein [Nostocaceae cyanobacterium]
MLPVPENRPGVYSCVHIGVYLINRTRNSYRFKPSEVLIPEIMTLEGQTLPRLLGIYEPPATVTTNTSSLGSKLTGLISKLTSLFERDDWLIESGDSICITVCTRLFWKNNKLRLEFYPDDFLGDIGNKYWWFDALETRNYQMRFIYLDARKNRNYFSITENRTTPEIASPFINLHFVNPVDTGDKAVEADSIRFETVASEKSLTIPEKEQELEIPVQLGMNITNNTQTPFRFSFYATLIPELVDSNGQVLYGSFSRNMLCSPTLSDYPLVMPGESLTFFLDAKLFWNCYREHLILQINSMDGGYYTFDYLSPGVYQFRFVYRKGNKQTTIYDRQITGTKSLEWERSAIVATPFVEISLVSVSD